MRGATRARRAPKNMAESGTPCGSSQCGEIDGHWLAGAVKRAFGCAPLSLDAGVQSSPFQLIPRAGGGLMSSHHTPPSSVFNTFVKRVFFLIVSIAFGLV